MATRITQDGIDFINKVCELNGESSFSGTLGTLPYSTDINGNPINKKWIASAIHNGGGLNTPNLLSQALIDWFNLYGEIYKLDPNILAAQAYVESGYKLWYYDFNKQNIGNSEVKSGINLFQIKTLFAVLINNFGDNDPRFTQEEINKITTGLDLPLQPASYEPKMGDAVDIKRSKINRGVLHQNMINNPEILIKAQAKYMKYLSDKSDKLASSSLFCYSRGVKYLDVTYSKVIQNAKDDNQGKYDNEFMKNGLDYVLKIFGILGDKNNALPFKNYKPKPLNGKSYYFGFNDLFSNDDLKSYPNTNFDVFNANLEESKEFNIEALDNLTIINNPKYQFIYFPPNQYNQVNKNIKLQIVLHHTVSGDKSGIAGDVKWWRDMGEKVATAFIVSREGGIYQLFNTDFWAHHLGIKQEFINSRQTLKSNEELNKYSIGIEIDSWGGLINFEGKWYPTLMDNDGDLQSFQPIKNAETVTNIQQYSSSNGYPNGFRGFRAFEKYTQDQINAVRDLIKSLNKKFPQIDLTYKQDMWDVSNNALNGNTGVWTHVSFRKDKSDCHPQPELITMLQNLKQGGVNEQFNADFVNSKSSPTLNGISQWNG